MSKSLKIDPITGLTKQPIGRVVFGGVLLFGVFALIGSSIPYFSFPYIYLSLTLWLLGVGAQIWIGLKPNLLGKFLYFVSLASLLSIIAIRIFNELFPNPKGFIGVVIVLSIIVAHAMPIFDIKTTRILRGELSLAPKTKIGKIMLKASLALLPSAGFLGAILGLFIHGNLGNISIKGIIAAPLCWYLAIILPFSTTYPISPWEYRKIEMEKQK